MTIFSEVICFIDRQVADDAVLLCESLRIKYLFHENAFCVEQFKKDIFIRNLNEFIGEENAKNEEFDVSESIEHYLADYFREYGGNLPPSGLYQRILVQMEKPLITAALTATRGNQLRAAELLGLNRNTLRDKIRKLDIKVIRTSE
jgi:DNA-binding protein Fis